MCNLYKVDRSSAEVARLFDGVDMSAGANLSEQLYPGYPGLVLVGGEVRSMVWGFPRHHLSKRTGLPLKPHPVNNARDDQLNNPFGLWKESFERRRCLIPVTAFAEAEGEKGRMTRTWISLPDRPMFACAGIWRRSEEWGDVYSMVMTRPSDATASVHDRMPVILHDDDFATWAEGSPSNALDLCKPYSGPVTIDRTLEPWFAKRS